MNVFRNMSRICLHDNRTQRCNRGEIFGATYSMLGAESAPPGWNRVKVSENLGATVVAPVAPAVTSLTNNSIAIAIAALKVFCHHDAPGE